MCVHCNSLHVAIIGCANPSSEILAHDAANMRVCLLSRCRWNAAVHVQYHGIMVEKGKPGKASVLYCSIDSCTHQEREVWRGGFNHVLSSLLNFGVDLGYDTPHNRPYTLEGGSLGFHIWGAFV